MSQDKSISFTSEAEFLVNAQALEQELAERYQEMADSMQVHNNLEVAGLFRKLGNYSETHAGELIHSANGLDLPQVPPWEYQWLTLDGPENCMQHTNYLMTPSQALQLAMRIERCAYDFYSQTAEETSDSNIRKLAVDMLTSKQKHLEQVSEWLLKASEQQPKTPEDLDPPHMPE
ncbi:MAG: ferritin family protein [Pseudomonadota bacterium]